MQNTFINFKPIITNLSKVSKCNNLVKLKLNGKFDDKKTNVMFT